MFFNSALQTLLIKVFVPWFLKGFTEVKAAIINPAGLVINMDSVIIQNIFITNLLNIVDFSYLSKLYERYTVEKFEGKNPITHSQYELNAYLTT